MKDSIALLLIFFVCGRFLLWTLTYDEWADAGKNIRTFLFCPATVTGQKTQMVETVIFAIAVVALSVAEELGYWSL